MANLKTGEKKTKAQNPDISESCEGAQGAAGTIHVPERQTVHESASV